MPAIPQVRVSRPRPLASVGGGRRREAPARARRRRQAAACTPRWLLPSAPLARADAAPARGWPQQEVGVLDAALTRPLEPKAFVRTGAFATAQGGPVALPNARFAAHAAPAPVRRAAAARRTAVGASRRCTAARRPHCAAAGGSLRGTPAVGCPCAPICAPAPALRARARPQRPPSPSRRAAADGGAFSAQAPPCWAPARVSAPSCAAATRRPRTRPWATATKLRPRPAWAPRRRRALPAAMAGPHRRCLRRATRARPTARRTWPQTETPRSTAPAWRRHRRRLQRWVRMRSQETPKRCRAATMTRPRRG